MAVRRWLRNLLGDGLLGYITYSISFVVFFNSGTNCMQVGRMILMCIAAAEEGTPDVNRDLVRLIGVVVLTAICLLQYFSPGIGRSLNRFLANVKIIFLVALIIAIAVANAKTVGRGNDWNESYNPTQPKLSPVKAFLAVLFSFEGWENATFVSLMSSCPPWGSLTEITRRVCDY